MLDAASSSYTALNMSADPNRPVIRITLSRPAVRNAFDEVLIRELRDALRVVREAIDAGSGPRAVVLTGSESAFSAGADLRWMQRQKQASVEENVADARELAALMQDLYRLPCFTLARVNGHAIGGGTGLVAACDVAVAALPAKFAFTEVKLGLIPAVISPYVMKRIGERHAREWFLTGALFDAATAAAIGLVQEAVPSEALDAAVERRIAAVLAAGPHAIRECKALIAQVSEASLDKLHELTTDWIARLRVSDEGQEGIGAFLEKRRPSYDVTPADS